MCPGAPPVPRWFKTALCLVAGVTDNRGPVAFVLRSPPVPRWFKTAFGPEAGVTDDRGTRCFCVPALRLSPPPILRTFSYIRLGGAAAMPLGCKDPMRPPVGSANLQPLNAMQTPRDREWQACNLVAGLSHGSDVISGVSVHLARL